MIGSFVVADANLDDFYRRVDRIQKTNRAGGGFEAAQAIGRSHYTRRRRRRLPVFGPVVIVLTVFVGLKGVIHAQIGAATYDRRVAALQTGTAAERVGAYVLRADGPTRFISRHVLELIAGR